MSKPGFGTCALVAGAMATLVLTQPAVAAPVLSNTVATKDAATDLVSEARWRGRRWGGFAAGVMAGMALGAIASSQYSYGYGPGYGYYGYSPGYYGYYGWGGGYGYGKQRPW